MVQNTNAVQQIALLKAELEKVQTTAAANLDGWQRTYAELQRSEADAAAFVESLQQMRAELEEARQESTAAVERLQAVDAELEQIRAAPSADPVAAEALEQARAEADAHYAEVLKLQAEVEKLRASDNPLLQEELLQARGEAAANLDGWQRTRAEFANFKKRTEANNGDIRQFASIALITKLLPVQDDFERAMKNMPETLKSETWVEGVQLIRRKVANVLEGEGVKALDVKKDDVFDPSVHEAITHDEDSEVQSGHVIEELQKGYKIGERILRPALVRVAK